MKPINCIAALLLFSSFAAAGLSSAQVIDIVGGKNGYLNPGEDANLLADQPLDVNGEAFWIAYSFRTTSPGTRNALFAVNDNTAAIESDNATLNSVFASVALLDATAFLEKNRLSAEDLKLFLSTQDESLRKTQGNYQTIVKNQLESKHPNVDFSSIETSLDALAASHQTTSDAVLQLFESRQLAKNFYAQPDLKAYVKNYNDTLLQFGVLSTASKKYRAALRNKVDELSNSAALNFSEKQEIKTALEKLGELPEYQSFYEGSVEPGRQAFNRALLQSSKNLQSEVDSTLYVLAKKDAEHAYTQEVKNKIAVLLSNSNQQLFAQCGIPTAELKDKWASVRSVMENTANATREAYLAVPTLVGEVNALAVDVTQKADACQNAPAPETAKKGVDAGLVTNVLIGAIAAIVLYALYKRYKKMREESAE